jgi:hypothetical protein
VNKTDDDLTMVEKVTQDGVSVWWGDNTRTLTRYDLKELIWELQRALKALEALEGIS